MGQTDYPTEQPTAPRQARLCTKVIVAWTLVLGACVAYRVAPTSVPIIFPGVVLLCSRAFLWPAFPAASRIVWPIFWCGQLLGIFAFVSVGFMGEWSLVALSLSAFISVGLVAFLLVSDVVLFYRSLRSR